MICFQFSDLKFAPVVLLLDGVENPLPNWLKNCSGEKAGKSEKPEIIFGNHEIIVLVELFPCPWAAESWVFASWFKAARFAAFNANCGVGTGVVGVLIGFGVGDSAVDVELFVGSCFIGWVWILAYLTLLSRSGVPELAAAVESNC